VGEALGVAQGGVGGKGLVQGVMPHWGCTWPGFPNILQHTCTVSWTDTAQVGPQKATHQKLGCQYGVMPRLMP